MTDAERPPVYQRQRIYTGAPSERVLLVTGDVNQDGNDEVVIAGRNGREGLWWLERDYTGAWRPHLIDDRYETLEAGGVLFDIDGDGRLDFVAGGDYRSNAIVWWQCPADPHRPWVRREVCRMPDNQSHDQIIADIDGDGRPELYFWNQRAKALFVVPIPADPTVTPWPGVKTVASGFPVREEGFAIADVDGDGRPELLAGLSWYEPDGRGGYARHVFAEGLVSPRLGAADFDGDGKNEIVVAEGDASFARPGLGRFVLFHQGTDPRQLWQPTILHEELEDPHSIAVADFDGDGHPDVFVGELGDPGGKHKHTPAQRIFFNRGGKLVEQVIDSGVGTHEAKALRLDGELAIVGKPYRDLKSQVPREPDADSVHLWQPEQTGGA
jgi:hypothetical protein